MGSQNLFVQTLPCRQELREEAGGTILSRNKAESVQIYAVEILDLMSEMTYSPLSEALQA